MAFEIYRESLIERDDGMPVDGPYETFTALVYNPSRVGLLQLRQSVQDADEVYVKVKERDEEGDCAVLVPDMIQAWLALRRNRGLKGAPDRLTPEQQENLAATFERAAARLEALATDEGNELATQLRASTLELMGMATMPYVQLESAPTQRVET